MSDKTKTPTKIDNIKFLFSQIEDKKDLIEKVASEFGLEISSVRVGWFTRFEIPTKYKVQDNLIIYLQNYLKK
ncbi:hypothetical protein M1M24_gp39 [Polaribacter phage Freya_1]|uniref:Uncharacterized protein n=2 Tax=Freyavirus TaxID=2948713 RepID=A0A8E5E9D1_9CAUD|nr:hypothetical protein M1M23_gp24 [Polaribacter phage Danklef_1]YP_010356728.1 hypothetical protein M1M24_gp39 [Polaribacter phage Freya_1]QQV90581.1 hypothetical protein Danklef2_25 [Polaribacter phage Danklef_2]QQV90658.1 hypothetical protein Danklef3_26 [Polaribacter phage Danklef_3]QQV90734.1 hypothetical protein Danklef4_25 [Polaribacter phage Danklef_4]QQV90812.1 hypothetical protein Danklef5_26 [Polaribacter phage Danklef_5]QQV90976.1 hypothetical protein Freya2_39 [Polaribacter phage